MPLYLLQVDFPFHGPWGREMTQSFIGLAQSIAQEEGLLWKFWTENPEKHEAGGLYLFKDAVNALRYLDLHATRLKAAGVAQVSGKLFVVNDELSRINCAPLDQGNPMNHTTSPQSLYLVQTDFSHQGPWGSEMASAYAELAHEFAKEKGLLWKIWTENPQAQAAGGIFVFGDAANAERFLVEHEARLKNGGFQGATCKLFAINEELSRIDRAPL